MENSRDYIAFISYRHCPLDIRIAETLHRMIERYRVPRELRKDGEKSLGTVFRDRDELPLSNNLTQDIYDALDHSQFLIVVCTPDTPKSQWVEREIEYFISKHGRDRVLTVLAAGTPEESIPRRITHDYAEDGSVIAEYEPLCAYLVDPSEKNILKNLKKEFLRLIAAMLNCPYDALRQRQKRYRMQQLTALMGVVTAIALVFTLMLGNRNREISNKNQEISQKNEEISIINQQIAEQLLQTQINETNALALLSQQQLADGDRIGAIESAFNALPHDNDGRPYSPDAEYALCQALNPYGNGKPAFHLTIEQPMDIHMMDVSDDGKYLVTLDVVGCIRCFDVDTAALLWEYQLDYSDKAVTSVDFHAQSLEIAEAQDRVVYSDMDDSYLLSLSSGELIVLLPFADNSENSATLSPDGQWLVQYGRPSSRQLGLEGEYRSYVPFYQFYSVETGEPVWWLSSNQSEDWYWDDPVFNEDGTKMAFVSYNRKDPQIWVWVYTYNQDAWVLEYSYYADPSLIDMMYGMYIELIWLPEGELILYYGEQEEDSRDYYRASIHKLDQDGNELAFHQYQIDHWNVLTSQIVTAAFDGISHIYVAYPESVLCFDIESCELEGAQPFYDQNIIIGYFRSNEFSVVFDDGSTKELSSSGYFTYASDLPSVNSEIRLACGYSSMAEILDKTATIGEAELVNGMDILCLVPENAPNTVQVIRSVYTGDNWFIPASIAEMKVDKLSNYKVYSFADVGFFMTKVTFLDDNGEKKTVASVLDESTGEIIHQFQWPEDDVFLGLSPDQSKLIFETCSFDLTTGTHGWELLAEELPSQGYGNTLERQAEVTKEAAVFVDGRFYGSDMTLYWWNEDHRIQKVPLPYGDGYVAYRPLYDFSETAEVGGSGLIVVQICNQTRNPYALYVGPDEYFIYSTTDGTYRRFPRQTSIEEESAFAIGCFRKEIAFADRDRVLRIYDFERNAVIHRWTLPVSPESILEMTYFYGDRYLLLFADRGETTSLIVMDTQDGSVVAELTLSSTYYASSFDDDLMFADYRDNLLLFSSYQTGTVIDLQTWSIIAEISALRYYLPESNTIIQSDHGGLEILRATSLYPWEELAEMGWELVNTVKENKLD